MRDASSVREKFVLHGLPVPDFDLPLACQMADAGLVLLVNDRGELSVTRVAFRLPPLQQRRQLTLQEGVEVVRLLQALR